MQRLLGYILRGGNFFAFLGLEMLCFLLIVNFNSRQEAIWAETWSVYFGGYNEWVAQRVAYFDLDEENDILRRENARLKALLPGSGYDIVEERDSFVQERYLQRFNYLATRVVNKAPYGPNNTLVIDRGSDLQVEIGQGVVAGEGLLGIVSAVTNRHARVLSILHQSTRISAGLSNGAFGTMRWDGFDPSLVTVSDLPDYVNVQPRDTVFTTGYSNVFPTGLVIGYVESTEPVAGTGAQNLKVRLANQPLNARTAYVVQDLFKEELRTITTDQVK